MTYARYGLFRYVKDDAAKREPYKNLKSTGPNLRGLARILLSNASNRAWRHSAKPLNDSWTAIGDLECVGERHGPGRRTCSVHALIRQTTTKSRISWTRFKKPRRSIFRRTFISTCSKACSARCLCVGRHSRKGRADYSGTRCKAPEAACLLPEETLNVGRAHLHAIRRHGGLSVRDLNKNNRDDVT